MLRQLELPPLRIEVQPADRVRGPPPEAYKNSTDPKGLILVVNWSFKGSANERLGSENDVQNIRSLFTQIGYRYESILDKTKDELLNALISFKEKEIHQGVDSLVCVFMSHGDENRLETSNGEFIDVKEIYHIFDNDKCVALAGKPKLFFFQHCRSKRKIDTKESGSQTDGSAIAETPNSSSYPSHGISDTYLCFSTERDSVSYRYPNKGSPFIEFLCRVFMKSAKDTRFFDLIPKVNYNLMQLDTPYKQRCEFTTIYHQHPFYFNPKGNPVYEQTANSGKTRQHPLGTGEETTMEKQSSVSRGASGTTSGARSRSLEGTETHRSHTECHTDSSLAKETYGLNDYPRGYVYILNNLSGCNEDVWVLKNIFDKLGFEVKIMPEIRSYRSLKKKISEYKITRNATVLVFFFGFGYEDNLYFAANDKESVSYKVFIEAFGLNREEGNASILFTNTCFKSKTPDTTAYRVPKEPVWDTFHVCVKVNGECLQGSILTKVLREEFIENGYRQEFAEFSRHVTCKIEELQKDEKDTYITDVRYYGVCKYYYFNPPSEKQEPSAKQGRSTADECQVSLKNSLSMQQAVQCLKEIEQSVCPSSKEHAWKHKKGDFVSTLDDACKTLNIGMLFKQLILLESHVLSNKWKASWKQWKQGYWKVMTDPYLDMKYSITRFIICLKFMEENLLDEAYKSDWRYSMGTNWLKKCNSLMVPLLQLTFYDDLFMNADAVLKQYGYSSFESYYEAADEVICNIKDAAEILKEKTKQTGYANVAAGSFGLLGLAGIGLTIVTGGLPLLIGGAILAAASLSTAIGVNIFQGKWNLEQINKVRKETESITAETMALTSLMEHYAFSVDKIKQEFDSLETNEAAEYLKKVGTECFSKKTDSDRFSRLVNIATILKPELFTNGVALYSVLIQAQNVTTVPPWINEENEAKKLYEDLRKRSSMVLRGFAVWEMVLGMKSIEEGTRLAEAFSSLAVNIDIAKTNIRNFSFEVACDRHSLKQ